MARTTTHARRGRTRARQAREGVGARVRALRLGAGLTQSDLGGERFSKEYVSQVELGKTMPSDAAMVWLAARLGVERTTLEGDGGLSARAECDAVVTRAEASVEARRYPEAVAELARVQRAVESSGDVHLALRHGTTLGWALHHLGRLDESADVLGAAVAAAAGVEDADHADALYRLGVVRFKLGSHATAVTLLDEALRLAGAADRTSDALRVRILNTRAKIRRRQKDFTAAAAKARSASSMRSSPRWALPMTSRAFPSSCRSSTRPPNSSIARFALSMAPSASPECSRAEARDEAAKAASTRLSSSTAIRNDSRRSGTASCGRPVIACSWPRLFRSLPTYSWSDTRSKSAFDRSAYSRARVYSLRRSATSDASR